MSLTNEYTINISMDESSILDAHLRLLFRAFHYETPCNKGPFTNYVYKRRGVGGQKNRLFVNFYTIENVNGGG